MNRAHHRQLSSLVLRLFQLTALVACLGLLPAKALAQDATSAPATLAVADQAATDDAVAATQAANEDDSAVTSSSSGDRPVGLLRPLLAVGLGIFVVLALMIGLKTHAFLALILGALTISCFVPLDVVGFSKQPPQVITVENAADISPTNIVKRVTSSLGGAVSGIGILIAMAAIVGKCMLVSGAADKVVKSMLEVFGEKRAALAMMISGFILSIPVFFDTVFYLLVPLARSLYRRTGKNYLLYLAAIAAGGAITHTLVPPTPGPLLVANELKDFGVEIGTVMLIGLAVGFPTALVGLLASFWLNKRMPIAMRPLSGNAAEEKELERTPTLLMSLLPVLLPVLLMACATVFKAAVPNPTGFLASVGTTIQFIGNADLAMILAAIFSIYLCWSVQGHSLRELAEHVEDALLSGGVIILITAAGGAFGALLAMTQIQDLVASVFANRESSGLLVIVVAYSIAALIKVAQGSSTVAMIIASSLVASIVAPLVANDELGFNPAYLVPTIGAGSLMGSWMNDSGFWVFAKMGVLTESETLRSWTVLLAILSLTGFALTLLLATIWPMV